MNVSRATPDPDVVSSLIAEAADTLILPRFRNLRPEDIEDKSTRADVEDLVTVVDRDVEAWLSAALTGIDPSALVIGEESVHSRPELLKWLAGDHPVWLLDPIDGTRNFARGHDGFGVMLSRVEAGQTRAAWILLPARGEMFVAEQGGGAFVNGTRVTVPAAPAVEPLRGSILARYMPADLRTHVERATAGRLDVRPGGACGAVDYTDLVKGRRDYTVYYRLLPWDHSAPALILSEAGGRVEHADGRAYTARSSNQPTVAARSQEVSALVRDILHVS